MSDFLFHDAPADAAVPADNIRIRAESSGSTVFGRVLMPALDDPKKRTPVVLFLHGFPGMEKNTDIAQLLRMTGVACAGFFYRGVWGSKGDYCFSHLIEDTFAVAAYLRRHAERYRIDPDRLYLFGHSMGGFAAVNAIAEGLKVRGAFFLAPCDAGGRYLTDKERFAKMMRKAKDSCFTVPSEDYIEKDAVQNAKKWAFVNAGRRMDPSARYLFIGGTRDTTTPKEKNIFPILELLRTRGAQVEYRELNDSHSFPGSRFQVAELAAKSLWETENG